MVFTTQIDVFSKKGYFKMFTDGIALEVQVGEVVPHVCRIDVQMQEPG